MRALLAAALAAVVMGNGGVPTASATGPPLELGTIRATAETVDATSVPVELLVRTPRPAPTTKATSAPTARATSRPIPPRTPRPVATKAPTARPTSVPATAAPTRAPSAPPAATDTPGTAEATPDPKPTVSPKPRPSQRPYDKEKVKADIRAAWPGTEKGSDDDAAIVVVGCETGQTFNPQMSSASYYSDPDDPRAGERRYLGLWQFTIGTWKANGGSGDPRDASPAEQTRVAWTLFQKRGWAPWPTCSSRI